ncbi:hypothetical protein TNCV_3752301 [Trichonephila clavipes]|nr:hypothetical protein TNCV_3752301 [Trichonephila clavipes]
MVPVDVGLSSPVLATISFSSPFPLTTLIRNCRLGGMVGLSLAFCSQELRVRTRHMSVDFHDPKNRQWPCRMIIRYGKDP